MAKKNDFESYCEYLEQNTSENIEYVRRVLWDKSKGKTDILLGIKAKVKEWDTVNYVSINIAVIAYIVSNFFLAYSLLPNALHTNLIALLFLSLNLIIVIIFWWHANRSKDFQYMPEWRKYILAVIDDLIEESKKNEQVYEIEVEEISSHKKSTYIGKIQKIK